MPDVVPFQPYSCDTKAAGMEDNDWIRAFFLGRLPVNTLTTVQEGEEFTVPFEFPPSLDAPNAPLYPESNSIFTAPDGSEHSVPCAVYNSSSAGSRSRQCPAPAFVSPIDPANNPNTCVLPCPVSAFSAAEYATMRLCAVVPGLVGLFTNAFMLL